MELIKVKSDEKNILISVPIELLVFAANDNPTYPMRVVDERKFVESVVKGIEHYADTNDIEIGVTHFNQFLDDVINNIYESGDECIEEAELPLSLVEKKV